MKDTMTRINPIRAISPQAAIVDNTALVSAIIDTAGYESLTFAILTGVESDADATFAVTMEHGDNSALSDTAAVASTDIVGTLALASFDFAADNVARKIGYIGIKRYVRMTITPSANTGNFFASAVAILGNPKTAPTSNPPA